MNPASLKDAEKLLKETTRALKGMRTSDVVVAPPLPFIASLKKLAGKSIALCAQDVFYEDTGAFTGFVSPGMEKSIGVSYVIIGHSERRAQGETDDLIAKKVAAALREKLTPVLCIGEHERDEHASHLAWLSSQIRTSLASVSAKELSRIVIAYEPVWAIGRGNEAIDARSLHETVIFIRKILAETFDRASADKVKILYGGSVDPANARTLIVESGITGFLVGRASLSPKTFAAIVKECGALKK